MDRQIDKHNDKQKKKDEHCAYNGGTRPNVRGPFSSSFNRALATLIGFFVSGKPKQHNKRKNTSYIYLSIWAWFTLATRRRKRRRKRRRRRRRKHEIRVMFDIPEVTMSPGLRQKECNNVLSLWNNERWHLTWYIDNHSEIPYKPCKTEKEQKRTEGFVFFCSISVSQGLYGISCFRLRLRFHLLSVNQALVCTRV